jgi:hypothetical protein
MDALGNGLCNTVYWADHSSRGVLPTVVRRCVWSRNLMNEEAINPRWTAAPKKKKKNILSLEIWGIEYIYIITH